MKDALGDRMKEQYEKRTRTFLPRRTYTIIRLDGKAFHTFTRGMNKPDDKVLMHAMDETAKFLCKEIQGCKMAYVQSDEISLLLTDFDKITTDAWFNGQVQKMVSVAASIATAKFNDIVKTQKWKIKDQKEVGLAFFDARAFTIPDPVEVENYFIYRQKDATRNSISMHAQSLYSHKELHGKSQADMYDMIHEKGDNWNNLPEGFKRGRTIVKEKKYEVVSPEILDNIISKVDWAIRTPDFLKERNELTDLVPKINDSLTEEE